MPQAERKETASASRDDRRSLIDCQTLDRILLFIENPKVRSDRISAESLEVASLPERRLSLTSLAAAPNHGLTLFSKSVAGTSRPTRRSFARPTVELARECCQDGPTCCEAPLSEHQARAPGCSAEQIASLDLGLQGPEAPEKFLLTDSWTYARHASRSSAASGERVPSLKSSAAPRRIASRSSD